MGLGLRDLRVWQEATALGALVVMHVPASTRPATRVLAERAVRAACEAAEWIADGFGRHAPLEQRRCFGSAKRALRRLETQVTSARLSRLLSESQHAEVIALIREVDRLLAGFLVYLERQAEGAQV